MKRIIVAQQLLLTFLLCIYTSISAQSISGNPNEWEEMLFPAQQGIQIKVFMQKVPNWGVQKVWWCAHNLTEDIAHSHPQMRGKRSVPIKRDEAYD